MARNPQQSETSVDRSKRSNEQVLRVWRIIAAECEIERWAQAVHRAEQASQEAEEARRLAEFAECEAIFELSYARARAAIAEAKRRALGTVSKAGATS